MLRQLTLVTLVAAATLFPAATATATATPTATATATANAGSASASAQDDTGIGVRLLDAPVATSYNPRARLYIIDHVAPGTVIERRIEVSNGSADRARIGVYAAGAEIKDGVFAGLAGDTPNELSTWITLSTPVLDLTDGDSEEVSATIRVPADAPPGEQYAVLWAQTSSGAKDGSGVTQVNRVGIRIYLSVGPGGEPASDFAIEALTPARDASGRPVVQATIRNTGGRALDLSGSLKLTKGPGGLSAGPFPVTLGTTLGIGETEPIDIALDKQLPNGPWRAQLRVTSGLLTDHAQATITFPEAGVGESVSPESPPAWWSWAGAVLLAAVLTALGWLIARRRRERPTTRTVRAPQGGALSQ